MLKVSPLKISYGNMKKLIDVTDICKSQLSDGTTITIPLGDCNRANYFGDPVPGVKKIILVKANNRITVHNDVKQVEINLATNTVVSTALSMIIWYGIGDKTRDVSNICMKSLRVGSTIVIPTGDVSRANYFGDPAPGIKKLVTVYNDGVWSQYQHWYHLEIDMKNNSIADYIHLKIHYGIGSAPVDVTSICISQLSSSDGVISIPAGDVNRAVYFGDPAFHQKKQIFIESDCVMKSYDDYFQITIEMDHKAVVGTVPEDMVMTRLKELRAGLTLKYGSFNDELPEQRMVARTLVGHEKVLEIGGNIGRNSLVIARVLKDPQNLVTLECDAGLAAQLTENRNANNMNFNIEASALSVRKLAQSRWVTVPVDELPPDSKWVNTITVDQVRAKYSNIVFDTIVADCEGAFYQILVDMPEILDNITLIIMENDYSDINQKIYVDQVLTQKNFYRCYTEGLPPGNDQPCASNFFEIWRRNPALV